MFDQNKPREVSDLVQVMDKLLAPGGCPWDREQTPQTLVRFAIEEAHELAEAIENNDVEGTKEELGDLLLQVVFHCALAKEVGTFTLEEVVETVCNKLIRRHPHVFGEKKTEVKNSEQVLAQWDKIKRTEKGERPQKGLGIPLTLPALQRAQKIGDKTRTLKFDWDNPPQVFSKVKEEFEELNEAFSKGNKAEIRDELGDMFFVLAQLARHLKLEAETVARAGNRKFETRFEKLMDVVKKRNLDFSKLSSEEKEVLWQEIKES